MIVSIMKTFYQLQITFIANGNTFNAISEITGLQPLEHDNSKVPDTWKHEVVQSENDPYFDFINVFVNHLETNRAQLHELGIRNENVSLWLVYEYDGQCNMEFDPVRLSELRIMV